MNLLKQTNGCLDKQQRRGIQQGAADGFTLEHIHLLKVLALKLNMTLN